MYADFFKERGRESGEERNINQLPPVCFPTRDQTHSQVCALTGNQTQNFLVHGRMLQPAKPPMQRQENHNFNVKGFFFFNAKKSISITVITFLKLLWVLLSELATHLNASKFKGGIKGGIQGFQSFSLSQGCI